MNVQNRVNTHSCLKKLPWVSALKNKKAIGKDREIPPAQE